jgi:CBS domain-containing protein
MKNFLLERIENIMTSQVKKVSPDTLMTEIAELFENYKYHHLPVVDSENVFIGMVSKSDYHKLQHHFTILKMGSYKEANEKLFSSLIASDVMQENLYVVQKNDILEVALDLFLENRFHSLVVLDQGKCAGIITPHDILKTLKSVAEDESRNNIQEGF